MALFLLCALPHHQNEKHNEGFDIRLEEGIGELKDRSVKFMQSEKKSEDSLRNIWDAKRGLIHLLQGAQKEKTERKGPKD